MSEFYKSNTFLAIVSFIAAICIWIYVAYEINPMYETWINDIPVKCINVSNSFDDGSLTVTGENKDILKGTLTTRVRVKGKRSVVSSITSKNFICTFDMITVNKAGNYTLKPIIESDVAGLEIIKAEPYNFDIRVENIEQRDIKIKIRTPGSLPDGYTIDDVKNHNESVRVTGATSIINRIDRAEVEFDYGALDVNDTEKTCRIEYYDNRGNSINPEFFKKTVEYAKITFNLYTTKEVTVVLMPKYADEITENRSGKTISLSLSGKGTPTKDGGLEMTLKLKGTSNALKKYLESKRTVYTEEINVLQIYSDKTFEKVPAAELSNNVWYVNVPEVNVKAKVIDKKK